jgi:tRNA(Leu) C34 or U34 (ribose-2'-O)-methylase TrmL
MTINWNILEQWAMGQRPLPAGFTLEYEFRPSLRWFPSIHSVHDYWKRFNQDKEGRLFWYLEKSEQQEWEKKYLLEKYKIFGKRQYFRCLWQRFTLTDINGKSITLMMNNKGRVYQVEKVKKTITYETYEVVQ